MRERIRQFVKIAADCLPIQGPVYEFGSLQVPGQEAFADLRPLFPGLAYTGADMRDGPGVDRILDLHDIDLPSGSVGCVISMDTLEHVEYPHRALEEIHRILSPTHGVAVISSVMYFPIHAYPCDYWRFTPQGFESLLKPFRHAFVGYAGCSFFPHSIVGIGFAGDPPDLSRFRDQFRLWQTAQRFDLANILLQLTPPVFIPVAERIYSRIMALKARKEQKWIRKN